MRKFIVASVFVFAGAVAIAHADLTDWGGDDCKGISGDASYCKTDDCKGIAKHNKSYCR
jgi:hypothetical protein